MKSLFVILAIAFISPHVAFSQEAPDDYLTTDVQFKAHDDVAMFGRLVLPKSNEPRAIVISVQTAEGATVDMKRSLGEGKTFNYYDVYRRKLTEMNIGHFSYDGRGIGMGDELPRYEKISWDIYNTSTLDNKVKDILSAVETVRQQKGLSETPIFLLGASEGTLLAAEAASKNPKDIKGLVLYGVLVTNLRETFRYIMSEGDFLKYRSMDANNDGSISPKEWEKVVKTAPFSAADKNEDGTFNVEDIKVLTRQYLDAIDANDFEVLHAWAKKSAAVSVPDNWFKDHFEHADNWSFLSKLDIPVGCFHGDMDAMTPIYAVKDLQAKAKKAGLDKMEFHYFKGYDHSLKIARYFVNGKLPKGHRAIFEFIDRIAPKP